MSASNDIKAIYAVVGAERFLRNEAIAQLLTRLDGEGDGLGPTRFEGPRAELAEVLDEVRTLSLLGDARVVLVDEADAFITANRKALEDYCQHPSDAGVLILLCKSMPKNTKLYKIIAKDGKVITTDTPSGRRVVPWIVDRAQNAYGKSMTQAAAASLREHAGDSVGELDAELAKLSAYVGQRQCIEPADIDALVGHHREEKVFAVTDAIANGDTASALEHWEQVLATDRAAPGRAIAGLAWGVRRLLDARRELDRGASLHTLARRLYVDPPVLERRLGRLSAAHLEQQLSDLCAADLAVKTGLGSLNTAIEKFIVRHCAAQHGTASTGASRRSRAASVG